MSDKLQYASKFDEAYYMMGVETSVSNYQGYVWMGAQTVEVCRRMMNFLGSIPGETILDWGCARGYYCRALNILGFKATGFDISEWAISRCDPAVEGLVSTIHPKETVDWILSKDQLEHCPYAILSATIDKFLWLARKGVLIIVPLTWEQGGKYLNPADMADSTHIIAWTLPQWLAFIQLAIDRSGRAFTVQGGYKLPGVKQAAEPYPYSTGFITIRKIQG